MSSSRRNTPNNNGTNTQQNPSTISRSLYSMRGKSWSCFQNVISNILADETELPVSDLRADVQRLDITDYGLYGVAPSEPGPMVICEECNHIMAPEGIMRHVKRVHGTKLPSTPKSRPTTTTATTTTAATAAAAAAAAAAARTTKTLSTSNTSLASAFSNRLNFSNKKPTLIQSIASNSLLSDRKHIKHKIAHNLEDVHVLLRKDDLINLQSSGNAGITGTTASTNSLQLTSSNLQSISSSISSTLSGISSSSNSNSSSSSSISKSTNSNDRKNRKILPVKDREYDPEKHCGVMGLGRPCTRSLTCKTHQISLRRNVVGRSKPFDQLLAEHRSNVRDKDTSLSNKIITKQAISSIISSEHNNQLMLIDSLMDNSNSSSSFDLDRRSVSSNSNHSSVTLGSFPNEASRSISQQHNNNSGNPATFSTMFSASNSTYDNQKGSSKGIQIIKTDKKLLNHSTSSSSLKNMKSSISTPSALSTPPKNKLPSRSISSSKPTSLTPANSSISIAINDYEMNHFNDLMGDDSEFWDDLGNSYDNNLITNESNKSQSISKTIDGGKIIGKRSNAHGAEHHIDKKRRRITENIINNIPNNLPATSTSNTNVDNVLNDNIKQNALITSELSLPRISTDISFNSSLYDPRNSASIDITTDNLLQSPTDKSVNHSYCDRNEESNTTKNAMHSQISEINSNGHNECTYVPKSINLDNKFKEQEPICIDDDDDNNLDSTNSKNTEIKSNKLPVISATDSTIKQYNDDGDNTEKNISTSDTELPTALALMTLTTSKSAKNYGLMTISKLLAEKDHQYSIGMKNNLEDCSSLPFASIPLDENENYILDVVYKCIRSGNIRNINERTDLNTNANCVKKEKENSIRNSIHENIDTTNSNDMPVKCLAKPIAINQFGMARGPGIAQLKHIVDSTKPSRQEIYQGLQNPQHSASLLGNASLIALRNNATYNSNGLIGISMLGQQTIISNKLMGTGNPIHTILSSGAGKAIFKKDLSSAIACVPNSNNPTTTGTIPAPINAVGSNLPGQYTIIRRPIMPQNIKLVPAQEDQNAFPVMPVVHRIRNRSLIPTVPQEYQDKTSKLLQNISKVFKIKLKNTIAHVYTHPTGKPNVTGKQLIGKKSMHKRSSSNNWVTYHSTPSSNLKESSSASSNACGKKISKTSLHQKSYSSSDVSPSDSSKHQSRQNGQLHTSSTTTNRHVSRHSNRNSSHSSHRSGRISSTNEKLNISIQLPESLLISKQTKSSS